MAFTHYVTADLPADKALLAVITVAYNGDMAADAFKGAGLADALRLIANYSGW